MHDPGAYLRRLHLPPAAVAPPSLEGLRALDAALARWFGVGPA